MWAPLAVGKAQIPSAAYGNALRQFDSYPGEVYSVPVSITAGPLFGLFRRYVLVSRFTWGILV